MTGLLLTGMSVYERRQARGDERGSRGVIAREDGTGFPNPNGTPTPPPAMR